MLSSMSSAVQVGHDSCTGNSDRIRWIKEELRKLDEERKPEEEHEQATRKFHEKRASLLRSLNDEQTLTKKLPPEIMSLVFQHICDRTYASSLVKTVMTLGRVSFQWRQIAWSTPQLWIKLVMGVGLRTMPHFLYLLQLYLHNVQSLPFSLHIGFAHHAQLFPRESLSALSEMLLDSAPKIRSLSLHHVPRQLIPDLSQGSFSHLEVLRIVLSRWTNVIPGFALKDLPCLRRLELQSVAPAPLELSWSILTSLHLSNIPIDICIKFLTQCTNLVEACIYDPVDPTTSTSRLLWETSADTITFPFLETFTWTYRPDPIYLALFQRIHASSLRTINWYGRDLPQESLQDALADNFPAPPTLTLLVFSHFKSWSLSFFQQAFSRTEHLQTLEFYWCDDKSVTNGLSSFLPGPETEEPVSYLPSLTKLQIWGEREMEISLDKWEWRILKFLERRWRHGLRGFDLDLSLVKVDWNPDLRRAILSLIGEGFNLGIYDGGALEPWLRKVP